MRRVLVVMLLAGVGARGAAADEVATALQAPEKVRLRAHVQVVGAFGLTEGTTVDGSGHRRDGATFDDMPVVEVGATRVRVVQDDDDARLMFWIEKTDLAPAIQRETRLSGKGDVGVWLLRGARVTASGHGARRRVVATVEGVTVRGMVPASALATVFEPPDEPPPVSGIKHAARLLDAPDGRPLLATPDGIEVHVIAPGSGDWVLAEHRSRTLRIRGWARTSAFLDEWHTSGTGAGSGYGISDTARVAVAAGTCFFADPGGPVVGVQLAPTIRYASSDHHGWWYLYVGNAWGLYTVAAHAISVDAKGAPTFAPCPGG